MRTTMHQLHLSSSIINRIINDPADLSKFPSKIGITTAQSDYILDVGYTKGFRSVFILNASLTAVATVASIVLIKHKELTRADETKLKEALTTFEMRKTSATGPTDAGATEKSAGKESHENGLVKDATTVSTSMKV